MKKQFEVFQDGSYIQYKENDKTIQIAYQIDKQIITNRNNMIFNHDIADNYIYHYIADNYVYHPPITIGHF